MTDPRTLFLTTHTPGRHNRQRWGLDFHHPVFPVSAGITLLFVIGVLIAPARARIVFDGVKSWSIGTFDWLFMLGGNLFVLFCLTPLLLPLGSIRLGGCNAKPQFSKLSWLAMLFAAGMGIGLMYWSVAEPVAYFTGWSNTPLDVAARTPQAAGMAMSATMYHWGLHPWASYAVVGLALAFFSYNKGLPLTIRSAFFPLLGERTWGPIGDCIDILAVLATLFGLATSLGFGALQASAGFAFLFGIDSGFSTQFAIIVVVSSIALVSVLRGLDGGVRVLSNINMIIALLLLCFVLVVGPTLAIFDTLGTTLLGYVENILALSNWIDRKDEAWMQGWTVFYWAWWISWSPFVGMFIARISYGRTVREFIIAVLLVPTAVTLVWMSVFGGSALEQVQSSVGTLSAGIDTVELALFQMLENLPLATISSSMGIVLVLVFFMTSSDSGSLVIDTITAGGKDDAPVVQRIFWVILQAAVAAALLFGGGADALGAIQAAAITVGLPFTLVLIAMCVCLAKGLMHERKYVLNRHAAPDPG